MPLVILSDAPAARVVAEAMPPEMKNLPPLRIFAPETVPLFRISLPPEETVGVVVTYPLTTIVPPFFTCVLLS